MGRPGRDSLSSQAQHSPAPQTEQSSRLAYVAVEEAEFLETMSSLAVRILSAFYIYYIR